ncbi:Rne/Rng family ribonuclease [Oscillatoria sp. CS-180]|uniref:Rne/Rng family ribonuclease n=1 Tax=Oscillatoria sp. CS-180 TaxID=3021720 RepID=UPI00232D4196|nr:Rne/Rng family ribonuclease [Oscillatoria sp. CS-180]MDB9524449.1 Rne/Rng family ribonuclease [Oscillatoria sp. CS-180]
MPKQIVIAEQHRIAAVFQGDQIQELVVATGTHQVGDIYVGTVENVLPGIDAAFVNIGDSERNGFMHVTDLGPLRLKRTAGSITELVAPQQKVLVQIMKEPTGNKGPRLTGNVTLPGRYLVLMPYGKGVNLSRRIQNEQERNRLRALAILLKPAGMGLLVRTEAEGVAEEAIIEDLEFLQKQWENIQQEALSKRPPELLNRDDDFIQRVLRDVYSGDVNRIVTDSHTGLKRVKQHLMNWNGGRIPSGVLIDHHRDRVPLLEFFRVNAAIKDAIQPRVDLPSGGYIIIEPTEALTVIDVNSGSFTRSATARETVLWTNCEAAEEIARQLRLRNVAGVIIVDFIDMDARRDQLQVLETFNRALKADKARPQISQLSELGLVELTRKRQGQNLYELFGRPCPACNGLGHLVHLPGEPATIDGAALEAARDSSTSISNRAIAHTAPPESLDPHSDLQELDLLNHPNYQESKGSRGSRRRRRRDSSPPSRSNGRNGDAPKSAPVAVADPVSTAETPASAPTTTHRSSRGRNGRGERKVAAPPEKVVVEMTPEEQSVYAMMGISPMVLSTQEVKDPKNTAIRVVLPGEKADLDDSSPSEDTEATSATTTDGPPVLKKSRKSRSSAEETEPESVAEPTTEAEQPTAESEPEPSESSDDADATPPAAEAEETTTTRRRRRRRSSANEDEG